MSGVVVGIDGGKRSRNLQFPQQLTLFLVWLQCRDGDDSFDGVCDGFDDEHDLNVAEIETG